MRVIEQRQEKKLDVNKMEKELEKELEWESILTDLAGHVKLKVMTEISFSNAIQISELSPLAKLFYCLNQVSNKTLRDTIGYKIERLILEAFKQKTTLEEIELQAWKGVCDKTISDAKHNSEKWKESQCRHVLRSGKHKGKPCHKYNCKLHSALMQPDSPSSPARKRARVE